MRYYLICWKDLYLYAFEIPLGSLWGIDKMKAMWIEGEEDRDKMLSILTDIEGLSRSELTVETL